MHRTYEETIEWLYARLPVFHRTGPAAYNKDLGKTRQLLEQLGDPHTRFKSVHVAGTNGKGSVSAMLAAIATAAGAPSGLGKVGLLTSPHLIDYTERIRISGEPVAKSWVVAWVQRHEAMIEQLSPTFFELNVAMAYDYFAQEEVNLAVVEVGLGGRLDSTNVITPLVSVITSIDFDHQELLGDTLGKIAAEKAGILKAAVPGVIGAVPTEAAEVIAAIAADVGAPLRWAERELRAERVGESASGSTIQINRMGKSGHAATYTLSLLGDYQLSNLATALLTVDVLRERGIQLPESAVERGLAHVQQLTGIRGRMEVLRAEPLVLADVAHNPQGIAAVMAQAERLCSERGGDLHVVIGASADKDVRAVVGLLPQHATYYYVKADLPRALPAPDLQALGEEVQLIGAYYSSVKAGLAAAVAFAETSDVVLVTGSIFVVGEALAEGTLIA